jgi:DNA polymerase-3 subunit alpha
MDFLDRVDIKGVSKKVIELLVQTGAFDEFGIARDTLFGNVEKAIEYAIKNKEDKDSGQTSLFEDSADSGMPSFAFDPFPEMGRLEKLNLEKQLLGFYFSGHPMDEFKEIWQRVVNINLSKIEDLRTGNSALVGIIRSIKQIITQKGSKMAFGTLSDYNGEIDLTIFPSVWEKYQDEFEIDNVLILKGKIDYQKDKDKYSFVVEEIVKKENVDSILPPEEIHIRLHADAANDENKLYTLKDFIAENSGNCMLFIHVPVMDKEKVIKIFHGINISSDTIDGLKNNICVEEIWRK